MFKGLGGINMRLKRTLALLNNLETPDNGDVILIINRIADKIREQIAIDDFKTIAKDYFTETEIKEMIDGCYTRESVMY